MNSNQIKAMKKIRKAEEQIVYANPKHCARLTTKIVKWKNNFFDAH